ncbi:GNAT family N-acetyltransferase [Allorhizobium borbori]|uniref:GNAT superfamily N-acetyltransferase n=1 Tax=Allorhizobium borbori TaxID=485907 RepID=A0A7W6K4K2_9HYPH|nr:GNAT family N-acetyltransferase [Allorhizobium borbori]MBB4105104.1 GNAT superfamily N-acetyltransferase [Allorhizobium borbori]
MPVIEKANPEDQAAVQAIVMAAYAHYIDRNGLTPGPMKDDYAALIAAGRVNVLRDETGVAGVLVLIPEEDCLLLDNVAVSPTAQGKGYGRILLDYAESIARAMSFARIRLYTQVIMTENQAIYAKRGYIETHRAVEKGLHRVFMEKVLA